MSTATTTKLTLDQSRLATFFRTFKPELGHVGTNGGLLWLYVRKPNGDDINVMCLGTCDTVGFGTISMSELGRVVRAAGKGQTLSLDIKDEKLTCTCDKLGTTEIEISNWSNDAGPDGLGNLQDFLGTLSVETVQQIGTIVDRCDLESFRFALSAVLVEDNVAVCSDGRRLAKLEIDGFDMGGKSIMLTNQLVRYAMATKQPIDVFKKSAIAGEVRDSFMEGRFPEWRKVLIPDVDCMTTLDGDKLRKDCQSQIAKSKLDDDEADGLELKLTMPDGEEITAMFSAKFLKAAVAKSDTLTLRWKSSAVKLRHLTGPVSITAEDRPVYNEVIMPMAR